LGTAVGVACDGARNRISFAINPDTAKTEPQTFADLLALSHAGEAA
jgi:hypothetical protein